MEFLAAFLVLCGVMSIADCLLIDSEVSHCVILASFSIRVCYKARPGENLYSIHFIALEDGANARLFLGDKAYLVRRGIEEKHTLDLFTIYKVILGDRKIGHYDNLGANVEGRVGECDKTASDASVYDKSAGFKAGVSDRIFR